MSQNPSFLIQWQNISVTVTEKQYSVFRTVKKKKIILNNSFATSNSLIAIMGPSGSGKTTFLGAISGKIKGKNGTLKINNVPVTDKDMCNISGYVHQEDVFTESLTVYEHMKFMAALKLHKTREERNGVIKKLLIELCLNENNHTIVGVLSGGQRRRLSLATELIDDPYILFCDEPTTGLDSFSAMSVSKILEATAMSGKLVLVTLHQPSSQIFDLYNNIILLANGKLIFQGSKVEAKLFFERANLYCPVSYNPADFYIKCITTNSENEEDYRRINWLSDLFHNHFQKRFCKDDYHTSGCFKERKKKNFLMQLQWLVWRDFIDFKRSIYRFKTSYACLTITALIIAISYSNVNFESISSAQSIQGALVLVISELVFTHMYYVIYIFPEEVQMFAKEKLIYSSFPYYLSKVFSLIPLCIINSVSFLTVYFIVLQFLHTFSLFVNMSVVLFFASLSGISLGLCLSALFPTIEYVHLFIVPLEIVIMIVSGIWIKLETLPEFLKAIKYVSPFYFGFESLSILCWKRVDFTANCTSEDVPPCYRNGEEVLKQYGFYEDYDVVGYNILYLFILILVYCSVGYLGILRKRAIYELH